MICCVIMVDIARDYLGNIIIKNGQFSHEKNVIYEYSGKQVSGVFPVSSIKDNRLEVEVVGTDPSQDLAFVRPIGGCFFEHDSGISVRFRDLKDASSFLSHFS